MNILKFIIALAIFSLIGVLLAVTLTQVAAVGAFVILGTGAIITSVLVYLIFRVFR